MCNPYKIFVDSSDTIYIWDDNCNRIRCLKDGKVTTVGGDGGSTGEEGPALSVG